MKTAASIFSWLGGIVTTIIAAVTLSQGQTVTNYRYDSYGGVGVYYATQEKVPYPGWVWVLFVIFAIIRLIILIWRESATSNGKKTGCGIMTLLFCSVIGGILTLCIPEEQLYGSSSSYKPVSDYHEQGTYIKPEPTKTHSVESQEQRIENNRTLLAKGIITQEEFDQRVQEIKNEYKNTIPKEKPKGQLSEEEIADLIIKYNKMKDDGIITQEEFENKKKDLLSKK